MERMQNPMAGAAEPGDGDPLAPLFRDYREACPDPEPSAQFTPGLWARIEARRNSSLWLRRYAEICVAATLAIVLLLTVFVAPKLTQESNYESYVDVLAAADSARDAALLPISDPAVPDSGGAIQ